MTCTRRSLLSGAMAMAAACGGAAARPEVHGSGAWPESHAHSLLTSLGMLTFAARHHASRLDTGHQRKGTGEIARLVREAAAAADVRVAHIPSMDTRTLRQRIIESIRADFHAGRTVTVDGWILAQSESRIYRLAALL